MPLTRFRPHLARLRRHLAPRRAPNPPTPERATTGAPSRKSTWLKTSPIQQTSWQSNASTRRRCEAKRTRWRTRFAFCEGEWRQAVVVIGRALLVEPKCDRISPARQSACRQAGANDRFLRVRAPELFNYLLHNASARASCSSEAAQAADRALARRASLPSRLGASSFPFCARVRRQKTNHTSAHSVDFRPCLRARPAANSINKQPDGVARIRI